MLHDDDTIAAAPGTWALLRIGHKDRDVSAKAHRLDVDGVTRCGFIARATLPAPPGARRCLICALSEGV